MSTISDAFAALKNVILMQERLDVMRAEQTRIAEDVSGLNAYVVAVDKRVIRIETMIEMGQARATPRQIEGQ